ncbi:MAG: hypothetical protein LQ345_003814 [Seirophora villosa]|nr:MAG: hypothetical protein LQ345_003814 [Seirophora villosa]
MTSPKTSSPSPSPPPFPLTSKDRQNLSRADSDFTPHSWSHLQRIITTNDLSSLLRRPSSLRRYLAWTAATNAQYGSITAYICQVRLRWTPLPSPSGPEFETATPVPFADARDYKILRNDWPYGVEKGIAHLIVWLKHRLDVQDNDKGDLTEEARAQVQAFVDRVFAQRLAGEGERVIWFRNWTGLQSVQGIEHVHVLVLGAGEELLEEWTGEGEKKGA